MTTGTSEVGELLKFLRRNGLSFAPGAGARSISSAEHRLGLTIPPPLANLLEICGGTDADQAFTETSTRHIRFWGVEELRLAEQDEVGDWAPALLFADYMIHSVEFGFAVARGTIVVAAGRETVQVADSLGQFIAAYIRDDPSILGQVVVRK